jgi:RimJ/RimL family protein N-acetyltransferase
MQQGSESASSSSTPRPNGSQPTSSTSTAASSARIVWNERERVAEWARQRIPHIRSWGEWYQAIGLERGALCAAVVYNLYSDADIAIHIASDGSRKWLNRAFLKVAFGYPFNQLKVRRLTGLVPARNVAAQAFDEHLGFRREGVIRHGMPDDDVILYGMLRAECRFI